jgi:hypothetical protein
MATNFYWRDDGVDFKVAVVIAKSSFDVLIEEERVGVWDVAFTLSDRTDFSPSGEGGGLQLFSALTDVLVDHVTRTTAKAITFSAVGASRQKLYDRWSRRLAASFPGRWEVKIRGDHVRRYTVSRVASSD